MASDAAADLLSGPRGRRLCWTLLGDSDHPGWARVQRGILGRDLAGLAGELAACVTLTDLTRISATTDGLALLAALGEPVTLARYWGPPDEEDRALSDPAVREALLPVARAVTAAPAAQWWATPVERDRQQYVEWLGDRDYAPALTGAAAELAARRSKMLEDERSARTRPEDPAAAFGGYWWSAPIPSRLPETTRSIPGIGAAGLALLEDGHGWRSARCWPVAPRPGARIYEVHGPAQWADLVGSYPLDVSKARRHEWWQVTGLAGRWLIPDFAAVAADYDAIHVSVAGYLATAGRALPVGDGRTVLAGWNPDQTFWLADVLAYAGPATHWVDQDRQPLGWTLVRSRATSVLPDLPDRQHQWRERDVMGDDEPVTDDIAAGSRASGVPPPSDGYVGDPVVEARWDQRYADREQLWSGQPNGALMAEVAGLVPGRVLDVGCGEGADAVWLAGAGWEVTALEVSGVALERAAGHARDAGVAIRWVHAGLAEAGLPPGSFDLVSAQYPALLRTPDAAAERALLAAVAPGGVLLLVHHAGMDAHPPEDGGFDPADYVWPTMVAALLNDDWEVEVDEERPRVAPDGGAGAHHAGDVVLRARRLR
jgi:SAM-dependent methyltransferase